MSQPFERQLDELSFPLTVRGLTEIPQLELRFHAGGDGGDRVVAWAHATENRHPWEWLEAGDLLMTAGLGLPARSRDQAAYVERLDDIDVSGIALGEDQMPELSAEMIETADRRRIPILLTGRDVAFGEIGKAVAAANSSSQLGCFVKAIHIYDLVRASVANESESVELFRKLEKEIGCRIFVCTDDGHVAAFGDDTDLPADVREAFLDAIGEYSGKPPSLLRLTSGAAAVHVVPVPTQRPTHLLVLPLAEAPPFALLQHVATVAALELERMWSRRDEMLRLGTETLGQLMDGRIAQGTLGALGRLGAGEGPFVALAIEGEPHPHALSDFSARLLTAKVPNLLLLRDRMLYALLACDQAAADRVAYLLPDGVRAGLSEEFHDPLRFSMAAQEAKWASGTAADGQLVAFRDPHFPLLGPRSQEETQEVVDGVLGPVLDYDRQNHTALLVSLKVFLLHNRSWKKATEDLAIHKQTLVHRIQRIEDLTGRTLNHTANVVELWMALCALDPTLASDQGGE